MVLMFRSMPIEEKRQMPYLMLDDFGEEMTQSEEIYSFVVDQLGQFPILHNET